MNNVSSNQELKHTVSLMMEVIRSSETSILTRATQHNIPEDGILHVITIIANVHTSRTEHSVLGLMPYIYIQELQVSNLGQETVFMALLSISGQWQDSILAGP
jgi:hypothetical protein